MDTPARILIIDDDYNYTFMMAELLQTKGYQVRTAFDGRSGLETFASGAVDLLLLDLSLPDISGLEVLSAIRRTSSLPVMVISGRGENKDTVQALEMGADDYLSKPFHDEELFARIAAVLRRVRWSPQTDSILEIRDLYIDVARRQVLVRGEKVHLTPIEFAILIILMQRAGQIVTHEELLSTVWGADYTGDYSVVRVNISRLRQKLEPNLGEPPYIQTVPRRGYRIAAPGVVYS